MNHLKEYLKELTDEGIIHQDVADNIMFMLNHELQHEIVLLSENKEK